MPKRNQPPTLKILALRQVSWPFRLLTKADNDEKQGSSISTTYRKQLSAQQTCFIRKKGEFGKKGRIIILPSVEALVNAWIRLSNYYGTPLKDMDQISIFLTFNVITTIDFLHEGFCLRSGEEISDIAGILPFTVQPELISPSTWQEISTLFRKLGPMKTIKNLFISFERLGFPPKVRVRVGNNDGTNRNQRPSAEDDIYRKHIHSAGGKTPPPFMTHQYHENKKEKRRKSSAKSKDKHEDKGRSKSIAKIHPDDPFKFNETFGFIQLRKLVVRGGATDYLMESLGINCPQLQHLDISSPLNRVSETGVILLLLQELEYKKRIEVMNDNVEIPDHFTRPLTKTLVYLDISSIQDQGVLGIDDWLITRICPQFVLCCTRLFFYQGGYLKSIARLKMRAMTDREIQKCVSRIKSEFDEEILNLSREFRNTLQFGFTEIRNRVTQDEENADESSIEFYQADRLAIMFTIEKSDWHTLTAYYSSNLDFINLRLLEKCTPSLKHIKSPLTGYISSVDSLPNLLSICAAVVETQETLFSILIRLHNLEYLEVREVYKAPGRLNDSDIKMIFHDRAPNKLEILRLMFGTDISLIVGVRGIFLSFKQLRVLGDISKWNVERGELDNLVQNLSYHNYDCMFEYGTTIIHTKTPCKEFFR